MVHADTFRMLILPKCTISKLRQLLMPFPKRLLPKSALAAALAPACGASDLWEMHLGKFHIWEVSTEKIVTWDVAPWKMPIG